MIGEAAVRTVVEAQLAARGLVDDGSGDGIRPEAFLKPQFEQYMSQTYASTTMSSADYATTALLDTHATVLNFGNHTCRPDVCHNGRGVGRLGFCRMMLWHWAKVENKKGEEEAKRRHGLLLQSHWDGVGWPPVQPLPHIGAVALEVNHPWYMKMHPAIALGPRCNHDAVCFCDCLCPPSQRIAPNPSRRRIYVR